MCLCRAAQLRPYKEAQLRLLRWTRWGFRGRRKCNGILPGGVRCNATVSRWVRRDCILVYSGISNTLPHPRVAKGIVCVLGLEPPAVLYTNHPPRQSRMWCTHGLGFHSQATAARSTVSQRRNGHNGEPEGLLGEFGTGLTP